MVNDQKYYCTFQFGAEILMVINSVVILICSVWLNFQMVTGSIGDTFVSLLLSSAYALFLPLMSYMYSQAQQYKLELRALVILLWMVIMEIIRILGDSTWELRKSLEQLVRLFWVGYLICSYPHWQGISWVSLLILCICSIGYEILKGIRFNKAKDSYLIEKNPKLIHNYMKRVMLEDDLKTTPIESCKYIVMGETNHEIVPCSYGYRFGEEKSNSEGLFTIGKAFQLNPSKAFTSANPSWRNTCLSLALAKMLRRRFAKQPKLPVDEAGFRKALDFVVEGLIDYIGSNKDKNDGDKSENGSKRVFSIIQEELQLVSDFLDFKVPDYNSYEWYNVIEFIGFFIIVGNWVYLGTFINNKTYYSGSFSRLMPRLKAYRYNNCSYYVHTTRGSPVLEVFTYLDSYITAFLFLAYMYLQILPKFLMKKSKRWCNLNSVMKYIKDPTNWNRSYCPPTIYKFGKLLVRFIILQADLFRKKARNYSSVLDLQAKTILFCIKVDVSTLMHLPKCIRRNIPRSYPNVDHSTDVKEAILESLKKSVAQLSVGEASPSLENFDEASLLTNGKASLKNYNMESLNWACMPNGSITEAILLWHIATTLFHHQEPSPQQNNDPHEKPANPENNSSIKKKQEVALALSSYCHYLVEFLPELLPDEVEWTQEMYESVTKKILGAIPRSCCKKPTKMDHYNYVLLHAGWDESSVVGKGVKLANQLMDYNKEGKPIWAMLADFWAEMMLFIAPSNNVEGHEKILYRQELITQLWALLTHAGIVTRSKPSDHQVHDSESNAFTEDMNV